MDDLSHSERGFSVVHCLLVAVLAGIIGATGWGVYRSQRAVQRVDENTQAGLAVPSTDPRAGLREAGVGDDQGIVVSDLPGADKPAVVTAGDTSLEINLANDRNRTLVYLRDGAAYFEEALNITAKGIDLAACQLEQAIILDNAGRSTETRRLQPKSSQIVWMEDGDHTFTVTCGSLKGQVVMRVADNLPKLCRNFSRTGENPITIANADELKAGMVGTWKGCVSSPWVPDYFVTVTFNGDGSYSAESSEVLDGNEMVATYYGMDEDHAGKKYRISSVGADHAGQGELDVIFPQVFTKDTAQLRNIRLMSGNLTFDYYHRGEYGPVRFDLQRN